jgi:hypothetical protein
MRRMRELESLQRVSYQSTQPATIDHDTELGERRVANISKGGGALAGSSGWPDVQA